MIAANFRHHWIPIQKLIYILKKFLVQYQSSEFTLAKRQKCRHWSSQEHPMSNEYRKLQIGIRQDHWNWFPSFEAQVLGVPSRHAEMTSAEMTSRAEMTSAAWHCPEMQRARRRFRSRRLQPVESRLFPFAFSSAS